MNYLFQQPEHPENAAVHEVQQGMSGGMNHLGQVIPPVKTETVKYVVLGTAGLIVVSIALFFLIRGGKRNGTQTQTSE